MIELIDPIISSNKVDISTGLNVHYLEASKNNNNQPIALLLHGFPELSFSWRKIIPILAYEGFRVISPSGELVEFIKFEDPYITNICFGSKDLQTAYITASYEGNLLEVPWARKGLALNFLNK